MDAVQNDNTPAGPGSEQPESHGQEKAAASRTSTLTAIEDSIRRPLHRMGLLPRLLAAEFLVLALVFAGGYLLISQSTNATNDRVRREWLLLGNTTGIALDAALADAVTSLHEGAAWYVAAGGQQDPTAAQEALNAVGSQASTFTSGVVVVDQNRRVIAADREHAGLLGIDLKAAWPQSSPPSAGSAPPLTWGFQLPPAGANTIAIAVPLGPDYPGGYLAGFIDAKHSELSRIMASAVTLGKSGHAELDNSSCQVLISTEPDLFLGPGDHPSFCVQMSRQGDPGVQQDVPEQNKGSDLPGMHLMAFVPLHTFPWALQIGTTMADAYAPSNQFQFDSLLFLAVLAGLALLATTLVARSVVRPIKALSAAADRVAEGKPTAGIRMAWGGEIGQLADSLEVMRIRLQGWAAELEGQVRQRTAELQERHRELQSLYEALHRQETQRRDLLSKVLTAQEDERRRVARELHDEVGQQIWALAINLEHLQTKRTSPAKLEAEIEALQKLAADSLTDLRRLTVALRPLALDDLGLVPAIRWYAELYLRNAGIDFEIAEDGLTGRLDPSLENIVYRVVQEAINNVARHSGATRARIQISAANATLVVTAEDNGRGFDVARTAESGVGLQGMEERAALAGGKLTVESKIGHGTLVRLEVPLRSSPETKQAE